jgi:hypothetical protein
MLGSGCVIAVGKPNRYKLTDNIVVKDEGPDCYVEVEKVPVPEIGTPRSSSSIARGLPYASAISCMGKRNHAN